MQSDSFQQLFGTKEGNPSFVPNSRWKESDCTILHLTYSKSWGTESSINTIPRTRGRSLHYLKQWVTYVTRSLWWQEKSDINAVNSSHLSQRHKALSQRSSRTKQKKSAPVFLRYQLAPASQLHQLNCPLNASQLLESAMGSLKGAATCHRTQESAYTNNALMEWWIVWFNWRWKIKKKRNEYWDKLVPQRKKDGTVWISRHFFAVLHCWVQIWISLCRTYVDDFRCIK